MKTCLLAVSLLALALPADARHDGHDHPHVLTLKAQELAAAVEARPPVMQPKLIVEFEDRHRRTIDFFPLMARKDQRGVRLGLMNLEQRRKTHGLLREVLSEQGYLCVQSIRGLEDVLRSTELTTGLMRDADAYTVQLFGTPSLEQPWALKFQGHHVSLKRDGRRRSAAWDAALPRRESRGGPYGNGCGAEGPRSAGGPGAGALGDAHGGPARRCAAIRVSAGADDPGRLARGTRRAVRPRRCVDERGAARDSEEARRQLRVALSSHGRRG